MADRDRDGAYLPGLIGSATAEESPYWPGTVVEVDADGPPRARLLLASLSRAELAAAGGGANG